MKRRKEYENDKLHNKSMVVALLKIEKVVSRIDRVDMLRYIWGPAVLTTGLNFLKDGNEK